MSNKKICYVASSGGHLEEILGLIPLKNYCDSIIITEKTKYKPLVWQQKLYFVHQVNRREPLCFLWLIFIFFKSIYIIFKEKPDIIITTGALMSVIVCVVGKKIFRKEIIYIESIARVTTASETGKFIYKFADLFIVQWESLLKLYPNAVLGDRII